MEFEWSYKSVDFYSCYVIQVRYINAVSIEMCIILQVVALWLNQTLFD